MAADVELLPLPEPYGYLRDLDGGLQMSIGPVRPADRAGGYTTPWVAMYDPGRVRACVAHAAAAKDAEIEALRAEVAEWKRVAAAQAELHGDAEACAERLAEALQNIRNVAREPYGTLNAAWVGTTADAALNTTAVQENDDA